MQVHLAIPMALSLIICFSPLLLSPAGFQFFSWLQVFVVYDDSKVCMIRPDFSLLLSAWCRNFLFGGKIMTYNMMKLLGSNLSKTWSLGKTVLYLKIDTTVKFTEICLTQTSFFKKMINFGALPFLCKFYHRSLICVFFSQKSSLLIQFSITLMRCRFFPLGMTYTFFFYQGADGAYKYPGLLHDGRYTINEYELHLRHGILSVPSTVWQQALFSSSIQVILLLYLLKDCSSTFSFSSPLDHPRGKIK